MHFHTFLIILYQNTHCARQWQRIAQTACDRLIDVATFTRRDGYMKRWCARWNEIANNFLSDSDISSPGHEPARNDTFYRSQVLPLREDSIVSVSFVEEGRKNHLRQ